MSLNLSINNFQNEHADIFKKFLTHCLPDFKLILNHNKFDEKTAQ